MVLRFGDFSIDTDAFELRRDGEPCEVEPLVFNLIAHFAAHPNRVLSRGDLIDAVWDGRVVTDATISTCVKNARKALGDTGETQTYLQTVRGRGYRFVAEVTRGGSVGPVAPTHREGPSIVILPFRPLSDDREIARIAQSQAIDLGTILTRIPLLRFSTEGGRYDPSDAPPTARQVHESLGVDFVVDGTVRTAAGRVRTDVQLSDARTGYRLWAESFDLEEPLAENYDAAVARIVGKIEPRIHRAMVGAASAESEAPTARQRFLEASGLLVREGWNHDSFVRAAELLRESIVLDPAFAHAHALRSLLYGFGSRIGLATDLESDKKEARRAAEQALELDSSDSIVLGFVGCSLADSGDLARGETLLRSAIEINPANAQARVALGTVYLARGETDEAIRLLSEGIAMSPLDSRLSVWGALLGCAFLVKGDPAAACEAAETACRRHDRTYLPRVVLAAARLSSGERELARRALADARRIKPDLTRGQIAAVVSSAWCDRLLALEADG